MQSSGLTTGRTAGCNRCRVTQNKHKVVDKVAVVLEQLAGNPTQPIALATAALLQSQTELHVVNTRLLQDDAANIKPDNGSVRDLRWPSLTIVSTVQKIV